jgi:hypothetical protein
MAHSQKSAPKEAGAPFASLLAAPSLVLALLLVAGFSYRWTYYYNFGLRELALQGPVSSVAINALELIRTPQNAVVSFCIAVIPLLMLNAALVLLGRFLPHSSRFLGLENRLVSDSLRAVVLIYSAYWAGSVTGWEKFRAHVNESTSTLPTVTAVVTSGSAESAFPFSCKQVDWSKSENSERALPPLIGAPSALTDLRDGLSCNTPNSRSWRMLYRDDKSVYLFAAGSGMGRPLTVVLPSTDSLVLILGATTDATAP